MKVLLIVGSGTSVESGAPSFKDFNKRIREYAVKYKSDQLFSSAFQNVVRYMDKYPTSDIEELFSFSHLDKRINNDATQTVNDIMLVIGKVLYDSLKNETEPLIENHKLVLENFTHDLHSLNVISFNWDVLFDLAASSRGSVNYGFDGIPGSPLLLKPHGSMNWNYCDKCKNILGINGKNPIFENPKRTSYCMACNGQLDQRLIVPPYFSKLSDWFGDQEKGKILIDKFRQVWRETYNAIKQAGVIVVIGYSFPKTDAEFLSIFKKAVFDSLIGEIRKTIILVSPNASSLRERLLDEFKESSTNGIVLESESPIKIKEPRLNIYALNMTFGNFAKHSKSIFEECTRMNLDL